MSQAECDELAQRADALKEENASLRAEVNRIKSEYEQLLSENASLKVIFKSWFDQALAFLLFFPRMGGSIAGESAIIVNVRIIAIFKGHSQFIP